MKPIIATQQMNAPLDLVWDACTDHTKWEAMIPAIIKLEMLSEGPFAVGTRWRETRKMFGKEATEVMWVTEIDPKRSYVVEAESHGSHYRSEFRFTPKDGGIQVDMEFGAEPLNFGAKVMMKVMGGMMKKTLVKCLAADLDAIRDAVEAKAKAQAPTQSQP